MLETTGKQPGQSTTRRVFMKQVFALAGVSGSAALLRACGSSSATATAAPAAAQQPTALATTEPAATAAATAGVASAPTTEASAAATPAAAAPTEGAPTTSGTPQIVAAANAFAATLNDTEKDTVLFDWTDTAQKQRWSNFPPSWVPTRRPDVGQSERDTAERLASADAGHSTLDQTYLAWDGPTTQGSAAYFRATGPTAVIEYSPQEIGGNPASHIHGIYRDPTNDYGAKYSK